MRGKPLLQWFLFALAWAFLLYPIIRVTRGGGGALHPVTEESRAETAWVSLQFSSQPVSFALHQEGVLLWEEKQPDALEFEQKLPVHFDRFGAEIGLVACLGDLATAVELTLEADGRPERSQTLWASGDVDEAVSFTWGAP